MALKWSQHNLISLSPPYPAENAVFVQGKFWTTEVLKDLLSIPLSDTYANPYRILFDIYFQTSQAIKLYRYTKYTDDSEM